MTVRKLDIPHAAPLRGRRGDALKRLPLRVEAAQFALLTRLAPSLRHRMIGGLHPISLLAELAARRLAADPPDLPSARDAIAKVQAQARLAAASSIATISWITGEEPPAIGIRDGVEACISLLRTDSEMRGTTITSQIGEVDTVVATRALRVVLTATVVAAVDATPRAAALDLHAAAEDDGIALRVETRALQGTVPAGFAGDARPLTWEDVQVLAQLEGVEVWSTAEPTALHCRFRRYQGPREAGGAKSP